MIGTISSIITKTAREKIDPPTTEEPEATTEATTETNTIFSPDENEEANSNFLNSSESLFDFSQGYPDMKDSSELENFFETNDYQLLEGESSKAINRILFDYNLGGI